VRNIITSNDIIEPTPSFSSSLTPHTAKQLINEPTVHQDERQLVLHTNERRGGLSHFETLLVNPPKIAGTPPLRTQVVNIYFETGPFAQCS